MPHITRSRVHRGKAQAPNTNPNNAYTAARRLPNVGAYVEIWWDDRDTSFRGHLQSRVKRRAHCFLIDYDDGDQLSTDLDNVFWRFVSTGGTSPHVGELEWHEPGDLTEMDRERRDRVFRTSSRSERCPKRTREVREDDKMDSEFEPSQASEKQGKRACKDHEKGSTGIRAFQKIFSPSEGVNVASSLGQEALSPRYIGDFESILEEVAVRKEEQVRSALGFESRYLKEWRILRGSDLPHRKRLTSTNLVRIPSGKHS